MEFRPCIDIHDGAVKQIVGGSLKEEGANENFVSKMDAAYYAQMYQKMGIKGGHVILLNKSGTAEYELTKKQAILALNTYENGLQVGGGINTDNALEFLNAGASHVIVTSFVFRDGLIDFDRLDKLVSITGKQHLVLDLSCRKVDDSYFIVTDRWQKYTDTILSADTMKKLENYCDEYLIHAVDVEGKSAGPDEALIDVLASYTGIPVTYAGGVHCFDDLKKIKCQTGGSINVTIGSALDIFGGNMKFDEVIKYIRDKNDEYHE